MMGKLKSIFQAIAFSFIVITCLFAWPIILAVGLFALLTSFFYLALREEAKTKGKEDEKK